MLMSLSASDSPEPGPDGESLSAELAFWFRSHWGKQEATPGCREARWLYKVSFTHFHARAGTMESFLALQVAKHHQDR